MTYLIEAGKKGFHPSMTFVSHVRQVSLFFILLNAGPDIADPVLVKTAVASFASVGASFQFPPVNWSVSLSPLMRLGFGKADSS